MPTVKLEKNCTMQVIEDLLIFLDQLEIDQPEYCKRDNWKNWKYIRNSIRDKYLKEI